MGYEADRSKERKCKECGNTYHDDAWRLKDHATSCKRLKAINMVVAGHIERV